MVDKIQKLEIKKKSEGEKEGLHPVLQASIIMCRCGETGNRYFTKNHMKDFLFAFYVTPKSRKKEDWLI